ncbi:MAG: carotenoid oxygenase family protein [Myxococcota bacterium]
MSRPASQPHASIYQNIGRTHAFEPLRVSGSLPSDLRGTLFRTGPGLHERFGKRVGHAFEADGVMSAVRLDGSGGAVGAVRVVQSAGYLEEEERGRFLYSTGASAIDRFRAILGGKGKATGNTSMWSYQGSLYALMEGWLPVRVDPATLETLGDTDLDGIIPQAFSAHPHRVPARNASFNFGVRYGRTMQIDVFVLPDDAPPQKLTTVEAPANAMVHDWVVTQTHLVLLVCPAHLRTVRAALGIGGLDKWFRWTPEAGTTAIVIPIDAPEDVRQFQVDPFWFWHTSNAWTEGNTLTVDLSWYPDLASLSDFGPGEGESTPPRLHRCTLDLRTGTFEHEVMHEQPVEFPQVHPGVLAQRSAVIFGLTEHENQHRGIVRLDDDGALSEWMPDDEGQASEPILVPRGDAEDDVWVLTLVHDDPTDASYVAVLDGQELERGPVAQVWFDQTIPETFHGLWRSGS